YLDHHKPKRGQVSVNVHCYPTLRYFYDEGPFADRSYYPRGFRLPYWSNPAPLIGDTSRYLICYRSIDYVKRLYPGVELEADPTLPSHLFRVQPAAPVHP